MITVILAAKRTRPRWDSPDIYNILLNDVRSCLLRRCRTRIARGLPKRSGLCGAYQCLEPELFDQVLFDADDVLQQQRLGRTLSAFAAQLDEFAVFFLRALDVIGL